MATSTPNFGLSKPDSALDTIAGTLLAMGVNMDVIDDMPLPVDSPGNSQLSAFKFANGILLMFGFIDHGTLYPCNQGPIGSGWYYSATFDVFWPIPITDPNRAAVIPLARSVENPDLQALSLSASTDRGTFRYNFPLRENGTVRKGFNVIVLAHWE